MKRPAKANLEPAPLVIDPNAIVRAEPNPTAIVRAYVESNFARILATEHERQVAVITAEGAAVVDAASYESVGLRLKEVSAHHRQVEDWFKPIKDWFYRAHQMVCAREREVLQPLRAFEATAKANILALQRAEEQKRREEERRLAEQQRRDEQERLAREAEHLEAVGEPELAAQVMEQAIHAPTPAVALASTLPATQGISSRDAWTWRPVGGDNAEARARAVQLVPREFLDLSDKKINAFVRAHGPSARIPGLQIFNRGAVHVRPR